MLALVAMATPLSLGAQLVAATLGFGLVAALALQLRAGRIRGLHAVALAATWLAVAGMVLLSLADGRGVLAFVFGAVGSSLASRFTLSKPLPPKPRRAVVRLAVGSVLLGLLLGLCLFAVWYLQASHDERVDTGWFLAVFVCFGSFGGAVAGAVVTLLT